MIKKIFCDMDGVLVDQHRQLAKIVGMTEEQYYNHIDTLNSHDKNAFIFDLIYKSIEVEGFINAPPTKEFESLLKIINFALDNGIEVEILTSCMSESTDEIFEEIKRQKKIWLRDHDLNHIHHNFSRGASKKPDFCDEGIVLIDDFERTINTWNDKGGYGILHIQGDINHTLKQLNSINSGFIFYE